MNHVMQEAVKKIWPCGNPNLSSERIQACAEKLEHKMQVLGYYVSNHGSYYHLAMEMHAINNGLRVNHNSECDIVTLVQ